MNLKVLLISFIILVFCTGCSNKYQNYNEAKSFTFTNKLVSVVPQKSDIDGVKINYTLQIDDFNPEDESFKEYIKQFERNSKYKHIHLTEQTKIYDSKGSLIDPLELKIDQNITFTVQFINDYNLVVTEVKEVSRSISK